MVANAPIRISEEVLPYLVPPSLLVRKYVGAIERFLISPERGYLDPSPLDAVRRLRIGERAVGFGTIRNNRLKRFQRRAARRATHGACPSYGTGCTCWGAPRGNSSAVTKTLPRLFKGPDIPCGVLTVCPPTVATDADYVAWRRNGGTMRLSVKSDNSGDLQGGGGNRVARFTPARYLQPPRIVKIIEGADKRRHLQTRFAMMNDARARARARSSMRRNVLRVRAAEPFGECGRAERGGQDSDAITADIVRRKSLN